MDTIDYVPMPRNSPNVQNIAVRVEGKKIGRIKCTLSGAQYITKSGVKGAMFNTLHECKQSLEAA